MWNEPSWSDSHHIFVILLKKALWKWPHFRFLLEWAHRHVFCVILHRMNKKVRSLITNKTEIETSQQTKRKQKLDRDGSPKHNQMKRIGLLGYWINLHMDSWWYKGGYISFGFLSSSKQLKPSQHQFTYFLEITQVSCLSRNKPEVTVRI